MLSCSEEKVEKNLVYVYIFAQCKDNLVQMADMLTPPCIIECTSLNVCFYLHTHYNNSHIYREPST